MFVGVMLSGTTPDNGGSGAVDRYTKYWSDSGHQDHAVIGSVVMLFAWILLVCFAAGLRQLLGVLTDSPLRSIVQSTGTAAAALFAVGGVLVNSQGVAAGQASGFHVDGNDALLLESVGYYILTAGVMMAATMAVAFTVANRAGRVVPSWVVFLTALLALVGAGNVLTAWVGFMLLPLWAVVVGGLLVATRGAVEEPATA